jgi:5-methylcytosine-specific restriction endonuclease McrA
MEENIDPKVEERKLKAQKMREYRARIAGPEARAKAAEQARKWREKNREHAREYNRAYYAKDIEKGRARSAAKSRRAKEKDPVGYNAKQAARMARWRGAHLDKAAAAMQRWRQKHYDEYRAYRASYYEKNAELIKAAVKKWREDNPEKWRAIAAVSGGQRRGAEGRFTLKDLEQKWEAQSGLCVYCQADLELSMEIDHKLPIARGGSNWPDNIQLLCFTCNRRKHAKTDVEFRALMT